FPDELGEPGEETAHHRLARAHRLVVVYLLIHVVPPEEERLDRRHALPPLDAELEPALDGHEREPAQEPVEVVAPVAYARHVAVAHEIVHAVDVERAAHGPGEEGVAVAPFEQGGHVLAHARSEGLERAMDLRA